MRMHERRKKTVVKLFLLQKWQSCKWAKRCILKNLGPWHTCIALWMSQHATKENEFCFVFVVPLFFPLSHFIFGKKEEKHQVFWREFIHDFNWVETLHLPEIDSQANFWIKKNTELYRTLRMFSIELLNYIKRL